VNSIWLYLLSTRLAKLHVHHPGHPQHGMNLAPNGNGVRLTRTLVSSICVICEDSDLHQGIRVVCHHLAKHPFSIPGERLYSGLRDICLYFLVESGSFV
jgi:hypothetical protein